MRLLLLLSGRAALHHRGRLLGVYFQSRGQLRWPISEPTAQLATLTTQPTNTPVASPAPPTLTSQAALAVVSTGRS